MRERKRCLAPNLRKVGNSKSNKMSQICEFYQMHCALLRTFLTKVRQSILKLEFHTAPAFCMKVKFNS